MTTAERPIYTFDVPEYMQRDVGVKTISLVELTANEELMAAKRARNDQAATMYELVKASVVAVDGKPLTLSDGTVDTWMDQANPKLRTLVTQAYNSLHTIQEADAMVFLKSRRVSV